MAEYLAEKRTRASQSQLRCRDIMTRNLKVATRESTLQQIAAMMRDSDAGIIPIVENENKLVGLITDRDIVVRAVADAKDVTTTKAEDVMTTEIYAANPDDRIFDVIRKMGDKQIRRVPVIDANRNLQGIISMADIALETEDDHDLAEVLEEISSGASFWRKG
jgi:CBS domain-containing protein